MSNKKLFEEQDRYVAPTPQELGKVVNSVGGVASACRIMRKNRATVMRWLKGDAKIDYANYKLLMSAITGRYE